MLHNQTRPKRVQPAAFSDGYTGTGVVSVKLTGLPDKVTHIVNGSLPSCSVVKP